MLAKNILHVETAQEVVRVPVGVDGTVFPKIRPRHAEKNELGTCGISRHMEHVM